MARVTLTALLFLLASALPLHAAAATAQPSPVPSPRPSTERHRQTEKPKTANISSQTNPHPTESSPTADQIARFSKLKTKANSARENSNYEERQYRLSVLLTWFNGVLAAFTVFLVLVGAYQGYQLQRTVEETKTSADAAKKSADVAEMALLRERPMLIVDDHVMSGFHAPITSVKGIEQTDPKYKEFLAAGFSVKNIGTRIAVVENVIATIEICPGEFPKGQFPEIGDYTACTPLYVKKVALKPDEADDHIVVYREAFLTQDEYDNIRMLKAVLVVYGLIRYRGTLKEPTYETPFFLIYQPAAGFVLTPFLYRGPAERNQAT